MTFNIWCYKRVKIGDILTLKDGRKVISLTEVDKSCTPRNSAYFKNVFYITVKLAD